jgi:predicted transcriptional regulator of viral defense system
MLFLDFKRHFEPFRVFSIRDILKWDAGFDTRRLVEWQDKRYIHKIINRWYIFAGTYDVNTLYLISNRIYSPSYVSLESALAHYRLIPEGVYTITAATSLKTQTFTTFMGTFSYRHIKPQMMLGYRLLNVDRHHCRIAGVEKALLDYFYLNPNINSPEQFEGLRLNQAELISQIGIDLLFKYLRLIKNRALEKRVGLFMKTVMDYAEG